MLAVKREWVLNVLFFYWKNNAKALTLQRLSDIIFKSDN